VALLPFAQLELPGSLPLPDGRYLVRPPLDDESEAAEEAPRPDVVVVHTLGAARPTGSGLLRRRRAREVEAEPGLHPLPLTRVSLIKSRPFGERRAAAQWLDSVSSDEQLATALLQETLSVLNRALLAFRVAAPDPYCGPVDPAAALTVRFGFGSGEEVADGRWEQARELPAPKGAGPRTRAIDSAGASERIAAVLGGRERISPAESLLSRAALCVLEERRGEAALLLGTAAEAISRAGAGAEAAAKAVQAGLRLRDAGLAGEEPAREELHTALRALREALPR
jgi:hypothetical protein